MRQRKKTRGPSPSRESQSVAATPARSELTTAEIVADPWTDEQETSLFKGMVRWKPVGMHKHFRMIALSQQLRNHGYTSPADGHTRIPGIWKKLESLYNLEALDERENSFIDEDPDENDPVTESFHDFQLPEDEYGELQFERRLAEEQSSSPPSLNYLQPTAPPKRGARSATRGRASTLDETEEESMSSPAPSRQRKSTRGGRGGRVGTRSRTQAEEKQSTKRKSGRIAQTIEEDEDEGSGEEEEEEESEENESEKEESAEESAAGSPTPTPRITAKAGRGGRPRKSQGGTRRSTRKK